jgi:hypothetical protein
MDAVEKYLSELEPLQKANVLEIRKLIQKNSPGLTEKVSDGKWLKGLIVYTTAEGHFVYALGPRSRGRTSFHMMPYYGSLALQKKYGSTLKKFLSGKSCILFKRSDDLPLAVIKEIIRSGTKKYRAVMNQMKKKGSKI